MFTTQAKKSDYMMSKSIVCDFVMDSMCVTYLLGGITVGMLDGLMMKVNFGSLLIALLGKIPMSLGWASLYTFINVILHRYLGVSIASSFAIGTGLLIIGEAAILDNGPALNIFLYGSPADACLSGSIGTLIMYLMISAVWAVVCNALETLVLSCSDVY